MIIKMYIVLHEKITIEYFRKIEERKSPHDVTAKVLEWPQIKQV